MPAGSKFARVSYVLFSIAMVAALVRLGGISDSKPFMLRMMPATPVAEARELSSQNLVGSLLRLPESRYTLGGELHPGTGARSDRVSDDTPVFYRPSAVREGNENPDKPVCGNLGNFPENSKVVFPLPETYFGSFEDTWGAARPQGGHEGTDLMSPTGTPEFAITDGTIVPVSGANSNGWNRLGGYTVMLEAAYDAGPIRRGDLFYYAHLNEETSLPVGAKVRAGQRLGFAGDTGEGREGTRGRFPAHLHLGWYDVSSASDRTNLQSGAMNPYPLLLWLQENGGAVSGGTDAAYCEAPQEPEPPADESNSAAQTSPDLDTGNANDARPSPVVEGNKRDDTPQRLNIPTEEQSLGSPVERTDKPAKEENPAKKSGDQDMPKSGVEQTSPSETGKVFSEPPDKHTPEAKVREQSVSLAPPTSPQDDQPSIPADHTEKETGPPARQPVPEHPSSAKDEKSEARSRVGSCSSLGKFDEESRVSITRHKNANQRNPITRKEWLALVDKDTELQVCKPVTGHQSVPHATTAVWTEHSSRNKVRFYLRGGSIIADSSDDATLEKARAIARALDAKVTDRRSKH